jgi:hypothetical protein
MNTKIALLLGNVVAPALQTSRAKDPKHNCSFKVCRDAQPPRTRERPALIMTWRIHPISGRLECRWSLERSAPADEGVSRTDLFRLAA